MQVRWEEMGSCGCDRRLANPSHTAKIQEHESKTHHKPAPPPSTRALSSSASQTSPPNWPCHSQKDQTSRRPSPTPGSCAPQRCRRDCSCARRRGRRRARWTGWGLGRAAGLCAEGCCAYCGGGGGGGRGRDARGELGWRWRGWLCAGWVSLVRSGFRHTHTNDIGRDVLDFSCGLCADGYCCASEDAYVLI